MKQTHHNNRLECYTGYWSWTDSLKLCKKWKTDDSELGILGFRSASLKTAASVSCI